MNDTYISHKICVGKIQNTSDWSSVGIIESLFEAYPYVIWSSAQSNFMELSSSCPFTDEKIEASVVKLFPQSQRGESDEILPNVLPRTPAVVRYNLQVKFKIFKVMIGTDSSLS